MITKNIEALLEGPVDPTWPLFMHVAPIIQQFIKTKGRVVITIDEVFSAQGTRRGGDKRKKAAEELLTEGFLKYLDAAVPHMHAVSSMFNEQFKPENGGKPYDTHTFEDQDGQYRVLADHLGRIMKASPYFSQDTRREVGRVVEHFKKPYSGFSLKGRRVHLGFKHGSLRLDQSPSTPIALSMFRIKDETRYSQEKLPRIICTRLMDYFRVVEALKRTEYPDLPKSAIEAFGGMEYFGLQTPFSEGARYTRLPDPMEYLLIGTRVSDVVGTTFVTRNREEVSALLRNLIYEKFLGSDTYTILRGKNLKRRDGTWRYEEGPVIDDHSQGREENGARPIFLYMLPKKESPVRVDVGLIDVHGLAKDSPPNERAHPLYEQKQLQEVLGWPIAYQKLFSVLAEALYPITKPINVRKYPLYVETTPTAK